MENTLENKRLFFAQYLGQKVLLKKRYFDLEEVTPTTLWFCKGRLVLKDAQLLSIEERVVYHYGVFADTLRQGGFVTDFRDAKVKDLVFMGWVKIVG